MAPPTSAPTPWRSLSSVGLAPQGLMAWCRLRLFVMLETVIHSAMKAMRRQRLSSVAEVRLALAAVRHMMAATVERAYLVFLVHLLVSMLG